MVLCFLDKVETQFRLFVSACLLKHYFFRLPSRLLLKSFQNLALGGDVILPVLINDCVVLYVKVHALFVLKGELIIITFDKQTNTTFVNPEENLPVLFYATSFLVRKSVLIE